MIRVMDGSHDYHDATQSNEIMVAAFSCAVRSARIMIAKVPIGRTLRSFQITGRGLLAKEPLIDRETGERPEPAIRSPFYGLSPTRSK
ncbi:hypothetical protein C100_06705 [Sphingobium sp. C100]|nr:hypothetical protein C100_06705 [Sphingobium sp. C100]